MEKLLFTCHYVETFFQKSFKSLNLTLLVMDTEPVLCHTLQVIDIFSHVKKCQKAQTFGYKNIWPIEVWTVNPQTTGCHYTNQAIPAIIAKSQ